MDDRSPLIKKALEYKSNTGPKARKWSDEEIDVFVWWLSGNLDQAQAAHALGIKGVHVATFASRALQQGIARKRLGVVWIPEGKGNSRKGHPFMRGHPDSALAGTREGALKDKLP